MEAKSTAQNFRVTKNDDLNYDFEIRTDYGTLDGHIAISINTISEMDYVHIHATLSKTVGR